MPVEDHPVHPSTMRGADARYGCHDRPEYVSGYMSPDGLWPSGCSTHQHIKMRFVPHVMSTSCRYDMSLSDPKCHACKHRGSGDEYDRKIREISA